MKFLLLKSSKYGSSYVIMLQRGNENDLNHRSMEFSAGYLTHPQRGKEGLQKTGIEVGKLLGCGTFSDKNFKLPK